MLDECTRLSDNGTDVNQTTKLGNTALIMACRSGQFETVKFLISKGADINRLGEDNQTALMNAIF
ncbi:MAG: ankyrin repeat domain-containing protein, partial [Ignavibacteriales bacterium]|nr:ankyrin repeat domain-containing protein [Ignavibacteriales bacterium]